MRPDIALTAACNSHLYNEFQRRFIYDVQCSQSASEAEGWRFEPSREH